MDTVQANIDPNQVGVPGDVLANAIDNFGGTGSTDPAYTALMNSSLFGGTDPLYASDGTPLVTASGGGIGGTLGATFASVPLWLWLAAGGVVLFAMLRR